MDVCAEQFVSGPVNLKSRGTYNLSRIALFCYDGEDIFDLSSVDVVHRRINKNMFWAWSRHRLWGV